MNHKEYMDRLSIYHKKVYIQIPNSLLRELTSEMSQQKLTAYTPYAFSFLVLSGFLYKYSHYIDLREGDYLNTGDMKCILKYNPNTQSINKITKPKEGFLENFSYIQTTTDIPIGVEYAKEKSFNIQQRTIVRMSDIPEYSKNLIYSQILRTPFYLAYLPEYMMDFGKKKGTLNNYQNTFTLSYEEFSYFIFNEEFTLKDFLLYCYLKSKHHFNKETSVTYETIETHTGIKYLTAKKSMSQLAKHGVINIKKYPNKKPTIATSHSYEIKKSFLKKYPLKQAKR